MNSRPARSTARNFTVDICMKLGPHISKEFEYLFQNFQTSKFRISILGASKSPQTNDFKNQQPGLAFLFSFKDLTNFGCPNLKFHLQISVYGYASYEGFLCVRACNSCLKASEFSPNNTLSLAKHYLELLLPLVTQGMMQRPPNPMEKRKVEFYIQILCRFQESKRKVPPPSTLSTKIQKNNFFQQQHFFVI